MKSIARVFRYRQTTGPFPQKLAMTRVIAPNYLADPDRLVFCERAEPALQEVVSQLAGASDLSR
jgi:sirohydrochlorin ferrochelatase